MTQLETIIQVLKLIGGLVIIWLLNEIRNEVKK